VSAALGALDLRAKFQPLSELTRCVQIYENLGILIDVLSVRYARNMYMGPHTMDKHLVTYREARLKAAEVAERGSSVALVLLRVSSPFHRRCQRLLTVVSSYVMRSPSVKEFARNSSRSSFRTRCPAVPASCFYCTEYWI
jgi:hypothetical protein